MDLTSAGFIALGQVVLIDLLLAGDNAVVIGLAAAGLNPSQRRKAIGVGILFATVLRILFAIVAVHLLAIAGLVLAGGFLLLWVCWKMWRELRNLPAADASIDTPQPLKKTFTQTVVQIVVADVSMSLDNVLAVAGAAREHPIVLVLGLVLSIGLMGIAANFIAQILERYRWLAFVGLAIILYVSLDMIYRGIVEVSPAILSLANL